MDILPRANKQNSIHRPERMMNIQPTKLAVTDQCNKQHELNKHEIRDSVTEFFFFTNKGINARHYYYEHVSPHLMRQSFFDRFRSNKKARSYFLIGVEQFFTELFKHPVDIYHFKHPETKSRQLICKKSLAHVKQDGCALELFRQQCWLNEELFPQDNSNANSRVPNSLITLCHWYFITLTYQNICNQPSISDFTLGVAKGRIAAARYLLKLDHKCLINCN